MNLFKKAIASVAVVSLVSGIFSVGASAYSTAQLEAATDLAAKGIIVAKNDAAGYALDQNVLRQEIAAVARGVAGLEKSDAYDAIFADVTTTSPNDWAYKTVEVLANAGLIAKNASFNPEQNITKAEAIGMVVKAAFGDAYSYDATKGTTWQEQVVAFAVENNVTTNFTNYDTNATRGFVFEAGSAAIAAAAVASADDAADDTDALLNLIFGGDDEEVAEEEAAEENTVVVSGDNVLNVTLSPETPDAASLPFSSEGVAVAKFDFSAGSEDVTVNSVTVKRSGLGSSTAVTNVALFTDEGRASKAKSFNSSSDDAVVNFSPALVVKAGETLTITAKVNTATSDANIGTFAVSLVSVNASSAVEGENIIANSFEVKSTQASAITFATDGTPSAPKLGEDQAEVLKFKVTNDSGTNEDITLTELTLKENGTIDEEEALTNVALYHDGNKVAEVDALTSKYVTFKLNEGIVITEGKTEKFVVKADVVTGANKTIEFYIDNELDVTASASKYGYVSVTNNLTTSTVSEVTVQAGEITVVSVDPTKTDIRKDKNDVEFGTVKFVANAGKDLELQQFKVTLANSDASSPVNIDTLLENVELYDETNGVVYDLSVDSGAGSATIKYKEDGLTIAIPNGGELVLVVRADTQNTTVDGAKITASVDVTSDVIIKETEDDTTVSDVVPAQVSFKTISGVTSSVVINEVAMSTTKSAVIGSTGIEVLNFEVKSDNDASALTLDELKVHGTVVDNADESAANDGSDENASNKRINALYLYQGDILLDKVSGGQLSSGVATFNGFNVEIDKNSSKRFVVKADIIDDANQANDTLNFQLTAYSVEDDEGDDVYVSGDTDKDGDLTDQGIQITSDRTVAIKGVGTLANATDLTDSEVDKNKNILGGVTSDFVASFEFTATNEDILIKDFTLDETGAQSLNNAVTEIIVYGNDKTTEIARQTVNSDSVTFNNANFTVEEGTSNIYVKVVTNKQGKDQAGQQTADLALKLTVTDAEGASSGKTVANPTQTADNSKLFSVNSTKVSALSFVTSYNGITVPSTLTAGDNNVAIIAITTDTSVNTDPTDGGNVATLLEQVKFTVDYGNITLATANDFSIERINGAGDTAISVDSDAATGTEVTLDVSTFTSDDKIENGTTAYYLIKAKAIALGGTSDNDSYIKVSFPTLSDSEIKYKSDGSSNNTSVTDLRLGITTLDGTQINE